MNTKLKKALDKVEQLDAEEQGELADFINQKAGQVYKVTPEERAALEESHRETSQGIFASGGAIAAIFAKLRNS